MLVDICQPAVQRSTLTSALQSRVFDVSVPGGGWTNLVGSRHDREMLEWNTFAIRNSTHIAVAAFLARELLLCCSLYCQTSTQPSQPAIS